MGKISCFQTYIKAWNNDGEFTLDEIDQLRKELIKVNIPSPTATLLTNQIKPQERSSSKRFKSNV